MSGNATVLTPAMEDYLEAIHALARRDGEAHVADIARRLKVRRPSVSGALRKLAKRRLVNYSPYSTVTLTDTGREAAVRVAKRHEALTSFLTEVLAVDTEEARKNACGMEHAMSDEVLQKFVDFVDFVKTCPRGGDRWIRGFQYHCKEEKAKSRCRHCLELCLADLGDGPLAEESSTSGATTLDKLKPGQKARILRVSRTGATTRRIANMGVVRGATVEVEKPHALRFADSVSVVASAEREG
jgi:DtxR family Mn-dependent transcriptional regulator